MNTKYEGYTNYETWMVANFLDNDEEAYGKIVDALAGTYHDSWPEALQRIVLENYIYVEKGGRLVDDIMGAFVDSVDWDDIALGYEELTDHEE